MFFDEKVFLAVVGGGFLRTPYLHAVNELDDNVDEEFDCQISGQVVHVPAALRVSGLTADNPPFRRVILTSNLTKRLTTANAIVYNQAQAGITFGFHDQPHHNVARAFMHDGETQYRGDPALILDVLESEPIERDESKADPVFLPSLYYKFDVETGEPVIPDDSFGDNPGEATGVVTFEDGVRGNALTIPEQGPGEFAYVDTRDPVQTVWNSSWSAAVWINLDDPPSTIVSLLEHEDDGNGAGYRWLSVLPDLSIRSNIGGMITKTSPGHLTPGIWHLIVVIAFAGSVRILIDGVSRGFQQHNRFLGDNTGKFRIGNASIPTDNFQFVGKVDELSLYNRVLIEQEIEDILTMGTNIGNRIDVPLNPGYNPKNPNFINRANRPHQPTGFLFFVSRHWKDERHVEPGLMMDHQIPLQYDQEFDSIPLIDGTFHLTIPVYGAKGAVKAYDLRLGKFNTGRIVGGGFLFVRYDDHGAPYLEIYGQGNPNDIIELAIEDDSGQFFSRRLLIEGVIPHRSIIQIPAQRIGTPVRIRVGALSAQGIEVDPDASILPDGVEYDGAAFIEGIPTEYGPYFEIAGRPVTECLENVTLWEDCPSQTALAVFAVNRPPRCLLKLNSCHGTTAGNDHHDGEYYAVQFMPYGLSLVYGGWAYRACRQFSSTFRYPRVMRIPFVYGWGNRRSGVGEELIWRTQVPELT